MGVETEKDFGGRGGAEPCDLDKNEHTLELQHKQSRATDLRLMMIFRPGF